MSPPDDQLETDLPKTDAYLAVSGPRYHNRELHFDLLAMVAIPMIGVRRIAISSRKRTRELAHDEQVAERFRRALRDRADVVEKRMMGGVCFMLQGNMIGGADRPKQGPARFMFRLGKDNPAADALTGGIPVVMGERAMPGYYFVEADSCDDANLDAWVVAATKHVLGLPSK